MPDGIFLYNTGGIREWWLSACGVCCAAASRNEHHEGGKGVRGTALVVTSVTFN